MIVMDLNSYTQLINIFTHVLNQPNRQDFLHYFLIFGGWDCIKQMHITQRLSGSVVSGVTCQRDVTETVPQLSILRCHHSL